MLSKPCPDEAERRESRPAVGKLPIEEFSDSFYTKQLRGIVLIPFGGTLEQKTANQTGDPQSHPEFSIDVPR